MIGQTNLLNKINTLTKYPRFSLIIGPSGSGKKMIVKYISDKFNLPIINFGIGIDEVRNIIDMSYSTPSPICYVCYDADSMSLGAKNALLKITEEPPENAYFILTLVSSSNTLGTILSRGTVFNLDPYSENELIQYRELKKYPNGNDNILREVCDNIGEVDALYKNSIKEFYEFAKTVAFKIQIPTSGNIFKIPKSMKLKEGDNGYDPILLFKAIRSLYIKEAIKTKDKKYLYASDVTSSCIRDLKLLTVSKLGTIDKWIMDVRKVLR